MLSMVAAVAAASVFSDYPGVRNANTAIEAIIDKGLVVEMIVRCDHNTGIVTYSRADRRYCDSRLRCHASLRAARRATCLGG